MTDKSELALNAITAVLRSHPNSEAILINVARIICKSIPEGHCIPPEAVNLLTQTDYLYESPM